MLYVHSCCRSRYIYTFVFIRETTNIILKKEVIVAVIVWQLVLQLTVQSVCITTNFVWGTTQAQITYDWGTTKVQITYVWGTTNVQITYDWGTTKAQITYDWGTNVDGLYLACVMALSQYVQNSIQQLQMKTKSNGHKTICTCTRKNRTLYQINEMTFLWIVLFDCPFGIL